MENASKALLIAAAILLAIILISLGIYIINQGSDLIRNNGMSQAQKTSFNQRFTQYEGDQKGSGVRSLIQEVVAADSDENNQDAGIFITVTGPGGVAIVSGDAQSGPTTSSTSVIKNTKTYTVEIGYGTNGFVNSVTINNKNQQ